MSGSLRDRVSTEDHRARKKLQMVLDEMGPFSPAHRNEEQVFDEYVERKLVERLKEKARRKEMVEDHYGVLADHTLAHEASEARELAEMLETRRKAEMMVTAKEVFDPGDHLEEPGAPRPKRGNELPGLTEANFEAGLLTVKLELRGHALPSQRDDTRTLSILRGAVHEWDLVRLLIADVRVQAERRGGGWVRDPSDPNGRLNLGYFMVRDRFMWAVIQMLRHEGLLEITNYATEAVEAVGYDLRGGVPLERGVVREQPWEKI